MSKRLDLVGQRFGRLTVQEFAGRHKQLSYWYCLCDCGNTKRILSSSLRGGKTKSCGCLNKELIARRSTTHGQLLNRLITSIYRIWHHMMQRCYNPKDNDYKNYGGRGIRVCERWHKFENFFADMGNPPEGMTLDRKDNDGDYCLENCRWATREEQNNNTRKNVWYEHNGERKTIAQWARSMCIKVSTLGMRLNKYGWSVERALTTKVRGRNYANV